MQTKEDLEKWYDIPDRWNYFNSLQDEFRREFILRMLDEEYVNALDIGCGECFVTQVLPAKNIYGIELSDNAASRFPSNVTRVHEPKGKYDLVVSTGTLYPQYDHEQMAKWIKESASHHILIGGIEQWLLPYEFGEIIEVRNLTYINDLNQKLTLYKVI